MRTNRAFDFHVASLRARAGDFEGGVSLLDAMLEESPDDDEVLYQLGVLYGTERLSEQALEYMLRALEINPDNPQALNYVGYTWVERGENLDQAERMILKALSQRPNDGYITDSLGWVYYMKARPLVNGGRHADALEYLEQARQKLTLAAELTGGDPVVSEHLGDVHLLMSDKLRALEFYKEAVSFEHRQAEQPDLLEKLEGLQQELDSE
jgi:tetratricopeptide (TPR) repeat protein